jgi:CRP/FNR family transcriptional regulator, dissimilatory nitrate respiration regulator
MQSTQPNGVKALLAKTSLFGGLADAELARLEAASRLIRLQRGDFLFNVGEPCKAMHVVADGRVRLFFTSRQGHEKVLEIVDCGGSVDEAQVLTDEAYTVTAQAMTDTQVIQISREAMVHELDIDPQLSLKMLRGLASREYRMLCDLESCAQHSGVQRVVAFLLDEIPASRAGCRSIELTLTVAKGVIASRISLTQEHFSRLLKSLSDRGLIHVDQKLIAIPDTARLRQLLN